MSLSEHEVSKGVISFEVNEPDTKNLRQGGNWTVERYLIVDEAAELARFLGWFWALPLTAYPVFSNHYHKIFQPELAHYFQDVICLEFPQEVGETASRNHYEIEEKNLAHEQYEKPIDDQAQPHLWHLFLFQELQMI